MLGVGRSGAHTARRLLCRLHGARSASSSSAVVSSPMNTATASGERAPQAACLVIGNEVLSGKVQDTNTHFLAKLLYSRGVDLIRVEVCPDEPDDIAASVRSLSARVGPSGFVFTSGGIGTTHDDVTYESVASAFGAGLQLHPPTVELMTSHYAKLGKELNAARMRMATLPEGCRVHTTPDLWVPLCQLRNVYILPGVPWLFQQMLEANRELFSGPALLNTTIYSHRGEGELAEALTAVAKAHNTISIGSYPNVSRATEKQFMTKLTFDGRDQAALDAAVAACREVIPCFDKLAE